MLKKNILLFIIACLTAPIAFSQSQAKIMKDPVTGSDMLYGQIDTTDLAKPPFSEWYVPGYSSYNPDAGTIVKLAGKNAPDYSYTLVMGTWCSDSHREVPRMMKVLDEAGVPADKIAIYAVNRSLKARQTPVKTLNITNVPTLIVSKNDRESGRIIESPTESVEKDLLGILKGGK